MLTGVTISGADDEVPYPELLALSREFPFVEWGLLMSENRAGTARYPSRRWLLGLGNTAATALHHGTIRMNLSAHFCGDVARAALAGRLHPFPVIERVQRIQVNGYEPPSPGVVKFARRMPSYEVILQARDERSVSLAVADIDEMSDASVLFDPSGGTGTEADRWPVPPAGIHMGFAGGITPKNVDLMLGEIVCGRPYWIDMESGVRTEDHFDLTKVRAVLEKCAPHVVGA